MTWLDQIRKAAKLTQQALNLLEEAEELWKQGRPTEKGRYLRVQGFHGVIIECRIIKEQQDLFVLERDHLGDIGQWQYRWPLEDCRFDKSWWFGPIPEPPEEARK